MDYKEYYDNNRTYIQIIDNRLRAVIKIVVGIAPQSLLDVGCGNGTLLNALRIELVDIELTGTDVYVQENSEWKYEVSDVTQKLNFADNSFDLIVVGEIIEHVPDPDFLLRECHRILKSNGKIIVTTPNLVSWANRIMVLCGTQPFFTETSTRMTLGRRFRLLGQGEKVQGHLKIFTHLSLKEILELNGFRVSQRRGTTFFFPFPLSLADNIFSKFVSLASGLIYVGEKVENELT